VKVKNLTDIDLVGGGGITADATGKLQLGGAVTSVTAGAGLVNSGTSAAPVIDVASAGATLTITADNIEVAAAIVSGAALGATAVQPAITITAGQGLTGGGTLAANRTLDVAAADATIVVAADSIRVGAINTANINANQVTTATIANGAVDNNKLAAMAAQTIKGNNSGGSSQPTDMTVATVLGLLGTFSVLAVQVFTAAGANTYTPTTGMKYCLVFATGAGGGGGGADCNAASTVQVGVGGGGGAGGTVIKAFPAASIGASQTVTIGTGGTAGSGTNGTNGGNGGNTTFGALITGTGGTGGTGSGLSAVAIQVSAGGAGGAPAGATANIPGGPGESRSGIASPITTPTEASLDGGCGGGSCWGTGADGGHIRQVTLAASSQAGGTATVPGAGAGGACNYDSTTGAAGGVGANGFCLILEFA